MVFRTDTPDMIDLAYYKRINAEFYRRVGAIGCVERLNAMGLEPMSIIGTFWPKQVQSLLNICDKNSRLHIITNVHPGLTVNRYVVGDCRYHLADGDDNPDIELRLPPEVVNHIFAELDHFIRRTGFGF